MDKKALHNILREEKARLGIWLHHQVKPYTGLLMVEGTHLLGTDDIFQINVAGGKMQLLYHEQKLAELSEQEGCLMIRHELCHVLDHMEGKIGHEFRGFKSDGQYPIESELFTGAIAEIVKAYCEFVMARRYISTFGIDEFRTQNEIGMDEFLALTQDFIREFQNPDSSLEAYALFGIIYGTFKEAVKVYFYRLRDVRFPGGIWDIVEWLCQDFDYLETLAIKWQQKSELLAFIALAIFENFELPSALKPAIARHKDDFTCKAYPVIGNASPLTQMLHDRWLRRFTDLEK